jgi:hypothetical protein
VNIKDDGEIRLVWLQQKCLVTMLVLGAAIGPSIA